MKNDLQNKFDNFGSIPNPEVWTEIENKLKQKRQKRGLIFWIFPTLAAILILFIGVNVLKPEDKLKTVQSQSTLTNKDTQAKINNNKNKDKFTVDNNNNDSFKHTIKPKSYVKHKAERKHLRTKKHNTNLDDTSISNLELNRNNLGSDSSNYLIIEPTLQIDSVSESITKNIDFNDSIKILDSNNLIVNIKDLQEEKKDEEKNSIWTVEFKISTSDARNNLDEIVNNQDPNGDQTNFLTTGIAEFNSLTSSNIASLTKPISLQLGLNLTCKNNLTFGTGINFDLMRTKLDNNVYNYKSVGLNLSLGYQFKINEKFALIPQLGTNVDFSLFNKSTSIQPILLQGNGEKISGLQNSIQMDLKLNYQINERFKLNLIPTNRYYFKQKIENLKLLDRKYWYGFQVSIQYTL